MRKLNSRRSHQNLMALSCKDRKPLLCMLTAVKIVKIGTQKIITIITLKMEQFGFTMQ